MIYGLIVIDFKSSLYVIHYNAEINLLVVDYPEKILRSKTVVYVDGGVKSSCSVA